MNSGSELYGVPTADNVRPSSHLSTPPESCGCNPGQPGGARVTAGKFRGVPAMLCGVCYFPRNYGQHCLLYEECDRCGNLDNPCPADALDVALMSESEKAAGRECRRINALPREVERARAMKAGEPFAGNGCYKGDCTFTDDTLYRNVNDLTPDAVLVRHWRDAHGIPVSAHLAHLAGLIAAMDEASGQPARA